MKKIIYNLVCSLAVTSLVMGCGHKKVDESKVQVSAFKIRDSEQIVLSNGLKVLFIDDQTLPRISFNTMIKAGSFHDPSSMDGLTNMVGDLLDQGSSKHNSGQIADIFAQMGSDFSSKTSQDYTILSTDGLVDNAGKLLDLYYECVTSPKFFNSELNRRKAETLAAISQMKDDPQSYAQLLLQQNAFTDSRYAHSAIGTEQSVKKIKRADILHQYQQYYTPDNSILAVTGQLSPEIKQQIISKFSGWTKQKVEATHSDVSYNGQDAQVIVYNHKGLAQTQLRFFAKGIPRANPDYVRLKIANTVLGGAFASRLNQKVRDELGLTYSIQSHFETLKNDGIFAIETFTRNDKVEDIIYNSLKVVDLYSKKGISENELRSSQSLTIGQYPTALETADKLAFNLMYLDLNGIDKSYLNNFIKEVRTTQLADINMMIPKYIRANDLKVVIYTDYDKTGEQIKSVMSKLQNDGIYGSTLKIKIINN